MKAVIVVSTTAASVAMLILGACGAFSGSDTTVPPTDAGSSSTDGESADGGVAVVDASGPPDAGSLTGDASTIDRDGSASRYCKDQPSTALICQDYDESSDVGGFYLGAYSATGTFSKVISGPASLTLENGYLHGRAPSSVNEAWIVAPAIKLATYTLVIKFRVTASLDIDIARLSTAKNGDLALHASPSTTTFDTPFLSAQITNTDNTTDRTLTLSYDGNTVTLKDDLGLTGQSPVNTTLQLTGVSVGVAQPSPAPADTFIDYYMLTSP